MPLLSELIADHAEMDVVLDRGLVHVAYRPSVLTPKWQREIGEREERGEDTTLTLFAPLRDCLKSWDIEEAPGVTYGFTDEALERIPRAILNQILWSLMTTARPNQSRPPVLSTDFVSELTTRPEPMTRKATKTATGAAS